MLLGHIDRVLSFVVVSLDREFRQVLVEELVDFSGEVSLPCFLGEQAVDIVHFFLAEKDVGVYSFGRICSLVVQDLSTAFQACIGIIN